MGYTHYWRHQGIDQNVWNEKLKTAKDILEDFKHLIRYEYEEDLPALADDQMIRFNGIEDAGHETFVLERAAQEFEFCKTAEKPYDIVVCLILLLFSDVVKVSSDGDLNDWSEALNYWQEKFGPIETPFLK